MPDNYKKVACIGLGYVGAPLAKFLKKQGHNVTEIDINTPLRAYSKLENATVFVCVPTPREPDDTSVITKVVDLIPHSALVVIRSTVPPSFCARLRKQKRKFVIWPEFLDAATAEQDFLNPQRTVFGSDDPSVVVGLCQITPSAGSSTIMCTPEEACMIKYGSNVFFLAKNVFFGGLSVMCAYMGVDYETVRQGIAADKRIGPVHTHVTVKGGKGAGGACLPKDGDVFVAIAERTLPADSAFLAMLQAAKASNDASLRISGKDDGRS